jgi:hypothetical protein
MPFDHYASSELPIDLAALGFQLKTLVVYSHFPRPLPQISVYGGVLEANLCLWLKRTLYSMPSLEHICILNYESATPAMYDMPSPRVIRMLRSSIFEDVLAECETLSEQNFEWQCLTDSLESSMSSCTAEEKKYRIRSSKLARPVEISFRSEKYLAAYGLVDSVKEMQAEPFPCEPVLDSGRTTTSLGRRRNLTWHKDISRPEEDTPKISSKSKYATTSQTQSTSFAGSRMRALRRKVTLFHHHHDHALSA